jgi:hypothetical protein
MRSAYPVSTVLAHAVIGPAADQLWSSVHCSRFKRDEAASGGEAGASASTQLERAELDGLSAVELLTADRPPRLGHVGSQVALVPEPLWDRSSITILGALYSAIRSAVVGSVRRLASYGAGGAVVDYLRVQVPADGNRALGWRHLTRSVYDTADGRRDAHPHCRVFAIAGQR